MNNPLISIVTVCYNAADEIENTIQSVLNQTYENLEYIIIDGASTDGTIEIIKEYKDKIACFISEPDKGIYDAMNKGISMATGDWICFLNAGDIFAFNNSLSKAITSSDNNNVDIIYGDSIEITSEFSKIVPASEDVKQMEYNPIYRHGSSLVRLEVHKNNLFDLSRKELGYALDWDLIHRLYLKGYKFKKVNVIIQEYKAEGTSNHQLLNRWYNYKITSNGKFNLKKFCILLRGAIAFLIKHTLFYDWLKAFFLVFVINDVLPHIPFWRIRRVYLKLLGLKIGKGSFIMKQVYFMNPNNLRIGEFSHINRGCTIDARGNISIGDNVSISHGVYIMSGSHNHQSSDFIGKMRPIYIDDYVWVGVGATILQNVTIGEGAVVCAGAVVNKNVGAYEIVAGVPAKKIGERKRDLRYHCHGKSPLT